MKLATVIDVEEGPQALKQALHTQALLLDRLGTRLDSIRLAVPRLLQHACAAAIAEAPDVLAIAGGPRSARRAGQLAHRHGIPILFLPGFRSSDWALRLWGGLSLEDMIAALARGAVERVRLGAGMAGGQLFFDCACCGLLPNLAELHGAWASDNFPEAQQALARAASLAPLILKPVVRFRTGDSVLRRATALCVHVQDTAPAESWRERRPPFACESWRHGWAGHLGAAVSTGFGAGWRRSAHAERFECAELTIESKRATWLVLDDDPMRLNGPIPFRFIPDALQTFSFNLRSVANDNAAQRRSRSEPFDIPPETQWNFPMSSRVASRESRESGDGRQRKQVRSCSVGL